MRNVIIIGCIVTLMLGSAISIAGEHEDRALIKAVDVGDFEKVKQLLANGANVNAIIPDDMGVVDYVPLNMAICS
ncbi:MAG: hypothetical protein GY697_07285, partial [Desulfobacterales bacterium]|nr:hypothetical protein [Desulfobacterales bacterium]